MYSTSFVFYLCIACLTLLLAVSGEGNEYERGNGKTESRIDLSSLRRQPKETDDEYYMRILERHPYEDYKQYMKRVMKTKKILHDLPIWDTNEYMKYAPVDISEMEAENSKHEAEEKEKKKHVKSIQLKDDTRDMFFRKILEVRSGESRKMYNKRIEKINNLLPELQEWRSATEKVKETTNSNKKKSREPLILTHDIDLKKNDIAHIYRYDEESEIDYYDRILRRHNHEDAEGYAQRLSYLMNALPNLRIWDVGPYTLHLPGRYTVTEIVEEVYYEEQMSRQVQKK